MAKETTHMNSRIVIIAGLGALLSTGLSTILFDIRVFILRYFEPIYNLWLDSVSQFSRSICPILSNGFNLHIFS